MQNIAPDITRKRLLLEGYYSIDVDRETVARYLTGVAAHLNLRTYAAPVIHSPSGAGKDSNQGFDAFIPLIDSGISLYTKFSQDRRFLSADDRPQLAGKQRARFDKQLIACRAQH